MDSVLQSTLPEIRRWIADLLERYRQVARPVITLGFPRLGHYFSAQTLSQAYVVEVDCVPKPPLTALGLHQFAEFEQMSADGITYQDTYFLKRGRTADESLHFHELVHIVQWKTLGPERFIQAYALGHMVSSGYLTNPLEQIAYALQDRFVRQDRPFNAERVVREHLCELKAIEIAADNRRPALSHRIGRS